MKVTKLTRHIGALVENVDLRKPLSATAVGDIRSALYEHHVIFFRDQDITEERQIEFTKELGPIIQTFKRWVNNIEDTADDPPAVDEWHTDFTTSPVPPAIAVLQSRIIPEFGGDTMWCSLRAIWKELSPAMKEFARGLTVQHGVKAHVLPHYQKTYPTMTAEEILAESQAVHPLVRTHPVTGEELLFLSKRFALQIRELSAAESRALLDHFESLMDDPNIQVRWRWRPYDIAIWDEPSTNHRALADHYPQHRLMRRTTIGGDAPFHRSAQPKVAAVG